MERSAVPRHLKGTIVPERIAPFPGIRRETKQNRSNGLGDFGLDAGLFGLLKHEPNAVHDFAGRVDLKRRRGIGNHLAVTGSRPISAKNFMPSPGTRFFTISIISSSVVCCSTGKGP